MPVKENQETEVAIEDVGSRGEGFAGIKGYLMPVPSSRIEERLRFRIRSGN
jgi:predicted RNA-binding protein with TRAM domain